MKNTNEHIVTLTVLWQYEAQNLLTNSSHSGTTHVSTTAGRPCTITNGQHWSNESHKVQRGSQKCQKSVTPCNPRPHHQSKKYRLFLAAYHNTPALPKTDPVMTQGTQCGAITFWAPKSKLLRTSLKGHGTQRGTLHKTFTCTAK